MEKRVWVNPRQPQTLYIAQLLLYFRGGTALLFGFVLGGLFTAFSLLFAVGNVVAAFGIANERRWGYRLGVVVAAYRLIETLLALADDFGRLWSYGIGLLFDLALVALLLHPMSRGYQRYWPKRSRG